MQLWDTAGQERFRSIVATYYRAAQAVMLVYDVNKPESFESLERWVRDVREHAPHNTLMIVVGNKCDSKGAHALIPASMGEAFARQIGACFIETSAKTSRNVDLAFASLATRFIDRQLTTLAPKQQPPGMPAASSTVLLQQGRHSSKPSCMCL